MKLALGLVFLLNLHLIHGYYFVMPLMDMSQPQVGSNQNGIFDQNYNKPLVYENSGVDENGNSFYERETIESNIQPFDNTQELPIESNDEDYFYDQPVQRNNHAIRLLNGLFNTPEKMGDSERRIIDISRNEFPDRAQDLRKLLGFGSRMPNMEQNHFFRNDVSGIDRPFKIEHKKDLEVTPRKLKIDVWGLNEAPFKRFEFLKQDSAINFNLPKVQMLSGLEDFRNKHEQDKPMLQVNMGLSEDEPQIITEFDQKTEKTLENELDDIVTSNQDHKTEIKDQVDQLVNFEKNILSKESQFLSGAFAAKLSSENQLIDPSYIYIQLSKKITESQAQKLLDFISRIAGFPFDFISDVSTVENLIVFKARNVDLDMLCSIIKDNEKLVLAQRGFKILSCNRGNVEIKRHSAHRDKRFVFIAATVASVVVIFALLFLIALFIARRRAYLRQKLIDSVGAFPKKKKFDDVEQLVEDVGTKPSLMNRVWPFKTKQVNTQQSDLCRSTKVNSTISPMNNTQCTDLGRTENFESTPITVDERKESNRSSASSWSEEPISSINMDITTGHAILSYMDGHLNDKNRLDKDWDDLCNYEADQSEVFVGMNEMNMNKNRYSNILPYDHNRVKLGSKKGNENDYINSSLITDDDPKNPAYIATQGPLSHTTSDFWQMIWEQNSIIIVSLCRTIEYGSSKCTQYWPTNGFEVHDGFEVHLVSEHVWCEEYLVRSFYLKNKSTNQTRTVTQFQYLTWPENNLPPNIKSILDFRRKINKSYNRKSFPIVVHCNDGIGRTGTYIMIDMILNKITKEAKEIDLAATLEYLRDQRKDMIKTKSQFEYSFAVITEEVQNMLKTLIH